MDRTGRSDTSVRARAAPPSRVAWSAENRNGDMAVPFRVQWEVGGAPRGRGGGFVGRPARRIRGLAGGVTQAASQVAGERLTRAAGPGETKPAAAAVALAHRSPPPS